MLAVNHKSGAHLAENDENAAEDGSLLRWQPFEEESGNDTKEWKGIQHEVEPFKDVVVDLVLFLDEVKVSFEKIKREIRNTIYTD